MPRIIIVKYSSYFYDGSEVVGACTNTDWKFVTDEELEEIRYYVQLYNRCKSNGTDKLDIIESRTIDELRKKEFKDVDDFLEKQREQKRIKAEKAKENSEKQKVNKLTKAKSDLEKKLKEIEKLKLELGDEL